MPEKARRKFRFWPLLGIILGSDLLVALLYAVLIPGPARRALSDAFCISSIGMGLLCSLPVLFDAGRSLGLAAKMGDPPEVREAALNRERQRREQGMTFTFAMGTAAIIMVIISFLMEMI